MSKEDNLNENWKKDFPILKQEATQVSRRDFAKFLTLVSGGLMVGSGLVAAKAYLLPKEELAGEHFVCKQDEVPVGGTRGFVIEGSNVSYILMYASFLFRFLQTGNWYYPLPLSRRFV
jgi:threonine/homoserine/homoserine lactone efflux protein